MGWLSAGCCQACGVVSPHLVCAACMAALPRNLQACQQCAVPLPQDALLCGECLSQPPPFSHTCAPFIYQAWIRDWISQFKYQHALHWGRWLGTALGQALSVQQTQAELIVPVPLHATRLCQRGFNQTAELARWVSRQMQIPWRTDLLQRIRQGPEQQGLSRRERQRNMQHPFRVVRPPSAHCIALLDDVVTTGTTVRVAAQALRQAGVPRVVVWAVARTPKPDTLSIQPQERRDESATTP